MTPDLKAVIEQGEAALHHLQADGTLDRAELASTLRALIDAAKQLDVMREFAEHLLVVHEDRTPELASQIVQSFMKGGDAHRPDEKQRAHSTAPDDAAAEQPLDRTGRCEAGDV